MGITGRVIGTLVMAGLGWCAGWVVGIARTAIPVPERFPFLVQNVPLPHHVAKYPGGLSLRFAMVQDVIHERFPKHGQAHYVERDRLTREKLGTLAPDDPARFPLEDDLSVGLDRLGKSAEAVEVLHGKLARQEASGLKGRELYTSYANLGTFLIHGSYKQAASGDQAAKARFREGIEFIRRSVEVNPEAHFGREQWQAAIAEFLLATTDDPTLLEKFDCLGNRLDLGIGSIMDREANWVGTGYGRPYTPQFGQGKADDEVPAFFQPRPWLDDPAQWPRLEPIRKFITRVGAEEGWEAVPVPSHRSPAPFDEPVLGIIGMWRQGGGANPHFALALGETMLRVGQRYLAWSAYERATRLADRFSGDASIQEHFKDHCRKRQVQLEDSLELNPQARDALRTKFDAELAYGLGYQKDYQDYEAARIASGVSIDDPHFFDEFPRNREVFASPVGTEEWYARLDRKRFNQYQASHPLACGTFGAGLAAIFFAFCSQLLAAWKSRRAKPARLAMLD